MRPDLPSAPTGGNLMAESMTNENDLIALPLVAPAMEETATDWHGWTALSPLPDPADSPLPMEPQGGYTEHTAGAAVSVPLVAQVGRGLQTTPQLGRPAELLAPAGGPDAAFAAFHFGADAIYLGLKKFSARAEAENFTLDEVDEVTAYAHSLQPSRRVFVTI